MKPNNPSSQRFISDSFARLLEAVAELEYGTATLSLYVQNGRLFRATIQREVSILAAETPERGTR
jgi:hypothetical protein